MRAPSILTICLYIDDIFSTRESDFCDAAIERRCMKPISIILHAIYCDALYYFWARRDILVASIIFRRRRYLLTIFIALDFAYIIADEKRPYSAE